MHAGLGQFVTIFSDFTAVASQALPALPAVSPAREGHHADSEATVGRPGSALAQRASRPGVSPGHTASPRWCTCTALACLQGCTDGCRAASDLT